MKTTPALAAALAATFIFGAATPAHAGTTKTLVHPNGGDVGSWSNRNHWVPIEVPTAADHVVIDGSSPPYAVLTAASTVASVTVRRDVEISRSNSQGRLDVTGELKVPASRRVRLVLPVRAAGGIVVDGHLTVDGALGGTTVLRGLGLTTLNGAIGTGGTLTVRSGHLALMGMSFGNLVVDGGTVFGKGGATGFEVRAGQLAPMVAYGGAPATLHATRFSMRDAAHFLVRLANGASSRVRASDVQLNSSGHSRCRVEPNQPAACAGPILSVWGSIPVGTTVMIVRNDGTGAVRGVFRNLRQGGTFVQDAKTYRINYQGGDGNDVTLTRTG